MAKEKINLRNELQAYQFEFGLLQKIPCTKQENKEYGKRLKEGGTIPAGIFRYTYENGEVSASEFYTIYKADLTEKETQEYLTYKKLSLLRTIKNCVMFFTVLTIIGLIAAFFIATGGM